MEGISNIYIKDLLMPRTKKFKNVYACDDIPSSLRNKKTFSIIVNLSKSHEPGTHWVAIFKDKDRLIYYDPIGFPLVNKYIKDFLQSFKQNWEYNLFEYQCIQSKLCGFFVILFVLLMEQNMTFTKFKNLFSKKCKYNNEKVINLLKYTIKKLYFYALHDFFH